MPPRKYCPILIRLIRAFTACPARERRPDRLFYGRFIKLHDLSVDVVLRKA
jgi:hypothetical protein